MIINKRLISPALGVLLVSVSVLFFTEYKNAMASTRVMAQTTDLDARSLTLGKPFFVEHYSNSSVKPQAPNTTFNTTGFGSGILNGTVKVKTEANATITFRNSETMLLQGHAKYVTPNGDTASYIFLELGKINPANLTYSGGGVAIFDGKATGRLASLNNLVAVYRLSLIHI